MKCNCKASVDFYENMYNEIFSTHRNGLCLLKKVLEKDVFIKIAKK